MIYTVDSMATELHKDKSISLSARWVLGRIGGLTQRGKQRCFASNEFLADECGLSKRTIQNALNELMSKGIIDTKVTLYKGKKTRYIYLIYEPQEKDALLEQNTLLDSAKKSKDNAEDAPSNSANFALSSILIEKDTRKRIERERKTHSISFDFQSIYQIMNELKNDFTDHIFTDKEIRDNVQSYLDKSQLYKLYQGEVTKEKLKAWMRSSIAYAKQKKIDVSPAPITLAELQQNSQVNDFEKFKRQILEDEQKKNQKNDLIEADFEIIDENKHAPA